MDAGKSDFIVAPSIRSIGRHRVGVISSDDKSINVFQPGDHHLSLLTEQYSEIY
jgi:hypothetical protein